MLYCERPGGFDTPPTDYGTGRKCWRCKARVQRYRKPKVGGKAGEVYCGRCEVAIMDEEWAEFQEEQQRKLDALNGLKARHRVIMPNRARDVTLPGLRALRLDADLTQRELGMVTGLGRRTVSRLERQERRASPETVYLLAQKLGCTHRELTG